jgi:iron complex outermembrane receptor protein
VTISRDAGEGRQIALRGLGPDFTRTQLNGMEVSASTASGFDNRGSVSRTRAFDYSIFASELFNRVTVRKAYAADQDEGGVAARSNCAPPSRSTIPASRPPCRPRPWATASPTGHAAPGGADLQPLGRRRLLVSAAYSESDVNEYGYRNWGWTPINVAAPISAPASRPPIATGWPTPPATIGCAPPRPRPIRPGSIIASAWGSPRPCNIAPCADTSLDVDLLYGRLSNDRDEFSLASAGKNGLTGDVLGTQRLNSVVIRGDDLVQAAFDGGVDLRSEHKHSIDTTVFTQVAVNGRTRLTDALELSGMVGHSRSDFEGPVFDKVFLQASNKAFAFDLRGPGRDGVNTYGFDPADPDAWSLMRADTREDSIVNASRPASWT